MIPDAAVLALLPADAILTVQVRAGDLLAALQQQAGGPEELSTTQAAQLIGRTSKWWRNQAEVGQIEGAYKDELDRWRLPNAAARAYHASQARPSGTSVASPHERSIRRGPVKNNRPKRPQLAAVRGGSQ